MKILEVTGLWAQQGKDPVLLIFSILPFSMFKFHPQAALPSLNWKSTVCSVLSHSHTGSETESLLQNHKKINPKLWLSEVTQSCLTLCDPMDCSLPGSSIQGIFQARVLEWGAISFSRRSPWCRGWTQVSCVVGRHFTILTTKWIKAWYLICP